MVNTKSSVAPFTARRNAALLFVLFCAPLLTFAAVWFRRGPGEYIIPYLIGAHLSAGAISAGFLAVMLHRWSGGWLRFVWLTCLATCVSFLLAGVFQIHAENLAVSHSEAGGRVIPDAGHRDFYPGDSGMSHWPTPWYFSLIVGLLNCPVWIPVLLLCVFVATEISRLLSWIGPRDPRVVASLLMVPTGLILIASIGLIPWLLETHARLDNRPWELQLLMATFALGAVCFSFPGIAARAIGRPRWGSGIVWGVAGLAYALVGVFILQSHFPWPSKFAIGCFSLLFCGMSCVGAGSDRPVV